MDFEKDVLAKSSEVPVVVDFWAPWCGPCQFLGPIIEGLAAEANGSWELVKINTDQEQQISARFGIRGIPAVKMFSKGKVVAEFTGALPKHEIQKWLNQHLPSEEKELLESIREKLAGGEGKATIELEKFVLDYPANDEARLLLAKNIVWTDAERARQLLAALTDRNGGFEDIERIELLAEFVSTSLEGTSPALGKLSAAREAFAAADVESGIALLIEAVMLDKTYNGELPRRVAVAVFQLLGAQNELSKKYRRRFDMALY